jgi:predicted peptidase
MDKKIKRLFITLFLIFFFLQSFSQVQTESPVYVSMTANSGGYYESLPINYNSNSQNYPLLLFVHGSGELGTGSPSQLPLVLHNGPPKMISQGTFPSSFTVNSQTFSFIVISPQFISWPQPGDIQDVINYLIQHYRIDQNRIYLTGLSMGGGTTWEYAGNQSAYANRLAAIVPISGASYPGMGHA